MSQRFFVNSYLRPLVVALDLIGLFLVFNLVYLIRLGRLHQNLLLNFDLLWIGFALLTTAYIFATYTLDSRISGLRTSGRFLLAVASTTGLITLVVYLGGREATDLLGRGVLFGGIFGFAFWGMTTRFFLRRWLKGQDQQMRWLVLGTPSFSKQFLEDYEAHGMRGQVDVLMPENWSDLSQKMKDDWTGIVVCTTDRLPEEVIKKLLEARMNGCMVLNLTDFYERVWDKIPVFFLDHSWLALTGGFSLLHNPIGFRIKRIGDVLGAILLLPFAIPTLVVAGLLVMLESGLPVIYRQTRTGSNGQDFTLFKLRTMRKDAEKDGARWTTDQDNRILKSGYLFRKSRIDELPQLWNVLLGDMSFIGPRPERPEFNQNLEKQIPHYNLRHVVRPGITGWAQVKYRYGSSVEDSREKLQYDLFYIKNYSVMMDVAIILKTIRTVVFHAGR